MFCLGSTRETESNSYTNCQFKLLGYNPNEFKTNNLTVKLHEIMQFSTSNLQNDIFSISTLQLRIGKTKLQQRTLQILKEKQVDK